MVNYTAADVPFTRIIEHKHFEFGQQPTTVVTYEYPAAWHEGAEPYYPINDHRNNRLAQAYKEMAQQQQRVLFGGRLGQYAYFDMDHVSRQRAFGAGVHDLCQVAVEERQNSLRFRVAEAAVEFDDFRAVRRNHEAGIEAALIGNAFLLRRFHGRFLRHGQAVFQLRL